MKKVITIALVLVCCFAAFANGSKETASSASSSAKTVVKVGVCGANNLQWQAVQKVLDEENAGIYIELVEFSAYTLPNEALNIGDIDLNSFQHVAFLNNEIAKQGYNITPIGDTLIAPLSLYSRKCGSLDELKAKAASSKSALKIGVPNDATNQGRAIKLLETAGLITVDPAAGFTPETKDITSYVSNIEVVPTDANTLPTLIDDFAACCINGTYAVPAGLVPSRDALIIESQSEGTANPFVNIIAARTADKDNPVYKKVVDAFHSQLVAEFILEAYKEAFYPTFEYDPNYTVSANFVEEITSYKSSKN
jgi:ABC-type metal ion transport system, periplasmic component/surface antigen